MSEIAVTAVGEDRPGIVAALTGALLGIGGNLADCRAALLRGSFAIALLVRVPDDVPPEEVDAALRPVAESLGLGLWTGPASSPHEGEAWGTRCTVSVYGADHPGIVHAVTRALADVGANVIDLSARAAGDPPVYVLAIEVDPPGGLSPEALEARLRPVADANAVDLAVTAQTDDVL